MPAEAIHLTALREALSSPRLDAEARRRILRHEQEARLGALLVDLPYFHRFPAQVARYALGLPPRASPWGERLHGRGPVEALLLLLRRGREDEPIGALALGLASHAAIDRALHPLVNALARAHGRPGRSHLGEHMEVEKYQSILFHESYHGRDLMGEHELSELLAISIAARLDVHEAGLAIAGSLAESFGVPLSRTEVASWGRGYRAHVRLLGSFVGKRICPEDAKARARPLFLSGAWGRFDALLAQAVDRSVDVLNAAAAALEADDGAASLLALLPPGTIDDAGLWVRLDEPYDVAFALGLPSSRAIQV